MHPCNISSTDSDETKRTQHEMKIIDMMTSLFTPTNNANHAESAVPEADADAARPVAKRQKSFMHSFMEKKIKTSRKQHIPQPTPPPPKKKKKKKKNKKAKQENNSDQTKKKHKKKPKLNPSLENITVSLLARCILYRMCDCGCGCATRSMC